MTKLAEILTSYLEGHKKMEPVEQVTLTRRFDDETDTAVVNALVETAAVAAKGARVSEARHFQSRLVEALGVLIGPDSRLSATAKVFVTQQLSPLLEDKR